MNSDRVRDAIQYALAVAGGADDAGELGVIHLLKYVYLADLAYAQKHGETFTGASWRFYKFGPWTEEVWSAVNEAAEGAGAIARTFSSPKFEGEGVRWRLRYGDAALKQLEDRLPWEVARAIRLHVKQFGDDTSELLHYVYATKPMLEAAPGQKLVFRAAEEPEKYEAAQTEEPTERQQKKQRQLREKLREELRVRMSQPKKTKLVAPDPAPRYDETFEEGLRALDAHGGDDVVSERGELTFGEGVWGSRGRRDTGDP